MKKVIVSGCLGQIGSWFVEYLLNTTDCEIYGFHYISEGDIDKWKNPRIKLFYADITDSAKIEELIKKIRPDYFINLAAISYVKENSDEPQRALKVNIVGVVNILKSLVKFAPQCRFFNAGSVLEFQQKEGDLISEDNLIKPSTYYGALKSATRHVIHSYRCEHQLFAIQNWLSNVESSRRNINFVTQKIVDGAVKIFKARQNNERFYPIELGSINIQKDFIHAVDVCDCIWKSLNQDIEQSEIEEFIICTGTNHSIREFLELTFKKLGMNIHWTKDGYKDEYETPIITINPELQRKEITNVHFSNKKAQNKLNWYPVYTFDMIVDEMLEVALNAK